MKQVIPTHEAHFQPHLAPLPSGERGRVRGTSEANCGNVCIALEAMNILELLNVSAIIVVTDLIESLK